MPKYKNRNTMFQKLHPLTQIMIVSVYIIVLLVINNPLYIIAIELSLLLLSEIDGSFEDVLKTAKFLLPDVLFIILLNPIVNQNGKTVLAHVALIHVIKFKITLEAVIYGIISGLKLTGITLVFGLANVTIHPDRLFGFLIKYLGSSALLMSITFRLFPEISASYKRIIETEKLRGNDITVGNFIERIKKQGSVINILFQSSIENSGDISEAMYARGLGAGRRSCYFYEKYSIYDAVFIIINSAIIALLIYFQLRGLNKCTFFPAFENPLGRISAAGIILCTAFYAVPLINWGWNAWK